MKVGIPNDKLTIAIIQNAVTGGHPLVHLELAVKTVTAIKRENVKGTTREKAVGVPAAWNYMRVHQVIKINQSYSNHAEEKADNDPVALNSARACWEVEVGDVSATAALNLAKTLGEEKAGDVPAPSALNPVRACREVEVGDGPAPAALNPARACREVEVDDVPAPAALNPARTL